MIEALTKREHEILRLLAAGMTNQEIADQLILSTGTVKAHINHIFGKLAVANRTQALRRAQEAGLLDDVPFTARHESSSSHNLPSQMTPFIGREKELATLAKMLLDPHVRLVTILGAGGMGKTHLAVEAARRNAGAFADGTFFVSLSQVSDARNISAAIIDALGLRHQPTSDLDATLCNLLQHKQMLLILDNFEHLLEGSNFLIQLLQATPSLKVLVTSRERLNLSSEVVFVLSGLEYSTSADHATFQEGDASQLLQYWLQVMNPTRVFSDEDIPHIVRICQLTQGMPLAIILAAGWLEMLSLAEIADEIANSIDILESQFRDLPERQRSMRATIASSWNRLTDEDQRIFARLSVFQGGFTRHAAESVTGASLRQLQTLVNRSLIVLNGGRYEIHELLRQFGKEQLLRDEHADDIYRAHSLYYLDFLRQRDTDLKGGRQREALDEIHRDYENVEKAWMWAAEHGLYDAMIQAIDSLCNFGAMRAFLVRIEKLFQNTLDSIVATPDTEVYQVVRDVVTLRHIHTRHRLSQPIESGVLEDMLKRARLRDDKREVAYCLWVLGNQALMERDNSNYRTYMAESLALWREVGDEFYIAHLLVGNCGEDMAPDLMMHAIEYLSESIEIRRRIGDQYELSFSLMMMGIRLLYSCVFDLAEHYFDECLNLQEDSHQTPDYAGVLSMKGSILFWRGDFDAAEAYAQAGINFSGDMNYYGDKSACQALLGFVASMRGNYDLGRALCEEAASYELFEVNAVAVEWGLALAYCGLNLNDEEVQYALKTCLFTARDRLKTSLFQYLSLPIAAVLIARQGNKEQAAALLGLAFAQPADINGWMHKWPLLDNLRQDLEHSLGAEPFEAAWSSGSQLELETVIDDLLNNS